MKTSTLRLVLTAFFIALILLLGMTPIGLIPLGFVNVTILCIPVIIGTLLLGLRPGLILGLSFGLVSTLAMFGLTLTTPSTLASTLLVANPFLAIVMCIAPRLLIPIATHAAYRIASRGKARSVRALPVAAIVGSLTNTVFYLGLMLLFYTATGLDAAKILALIGGIGLIAGGSEAAVAAVLATPIMSALWKVKKLSDSGE